MKSKFSLAKELATMAKQYIRKSLIRNSYDLLKWSGGVYAPWVHKKLTEKHVAQVLSKIKAGDIFLGTIYGAFTNILISGLTKHAAVFACDEKDQSLCIVEAVSDGVQKVGLYDFMLTRDIVIVLRSKQSTETQRKRAGKYALDLVGRDYDYDLFIPKSKDELNESFYCAELCYWVHKLANSTFEFKAKEVMGIPTVTPEDFRKATKHWEVIWDSRKHI